MPAAGTPTFDLGREATLFGDGHAHSKHDDTDEAQETKCRTCIHAAILSAEHVPAYEAWGRAPRARQACVASPRVSAVSRCGSALNVTR